MNRAPLSKIAYEKIVVAGNTALQQVFSGVSFENNEWKVKHTRKKVCMMLPLDYSILSYMITLKTT